MSLYLPVKYKKHSIGSGGQLSLTNAH